MFLRPDFAIHTYIPNGIVNEITGILVQIYHNLQQTLVFGKVMGRFYKQVVTISMDRVKRSCRLDSRITNREMCSKTYILQRNGLLLCQNKQPL